MSNQPQQPGEAASPDGEEDQNEPVTLTTKTVEKFYGVLPEIRPASMYLDDGDRNMSLEKPFRRETVSLLESVDGFSDLLEAGWIIPVPAKFRTRHTRNKRWFDMDTTCSADPVLGQAFDVLEHNQNVLWDNPFISLNTMWVPSLPDGYSALILPLHGTGDSRMATVPSMVDIDSEGGELTFYVQVLEDYLSVETGEWAAQLIPIDRQRSAMDASVEPMSKKDAGETGEDTEEDVDD